MLIRSRIICARSTYAGAYRGCRLRSSVVESSARFNTSIDSSGTFSPRKIAASSFCNALQSCCDIPGRGDASWSTRTAPEGEASGSNRAAKTRLSFTERPDIVKCLLVSAGMYIRIIPEFKIRTRGRSLLLSKRVGGPTDKTRSRAQDPAAGPLRCDTKPRLPATHLRSHTHAGP